ncbi:uncharacterized protein RJT21DRAFT_113665 [Scheffersomyces amazonensis]|uniref:uncharacterized protein n=1 Tax=Scheffersomyces amazonensis TaxID=1078765 RepID=UPI00315DE3D4
MDTGKIRTRISYSCTNCRKRKVKCNRKKPQCSACQRNRIPAHLCVYEASPHVLRAAAEAAAALSLESGSTSTLPDAKNIYKLESHDGLYAGRTENINSTTYIKGTSSILYDLSQFILYKPHFDVSAYLGATCWRTIIQKLFQSHPIVIESSEKTRVDIKSWMKQSRVEEPRPTKELESILPIYKDMSKLLSNFLQQQDQLIFKCFSSNDVYRYFDNTFDKHGKLKSNHSQIELCITLAIIIISCQLSGEFKNNQIELIGNLKLIFSNCSFGCTIPELQAMILLHEVKKFNFHERYKHKLSIQEINLLSTICSMATLLGLNRNIDKIHKGDLAYITSLKNMWKYILFEDTIKSFQSGHQTLINDDYVEHKLLDDDVFNYKERIEVMRGVCKRVNSYNLSKQVDLDYEIQISKNLASKDLEPNYISLALVQCLVNIKYYKSPTVSNLNECFDTSFSLYKVAKSFLEKGKTSDTLHAREALFRASYALLYILLGQIEDRVSLYKNGEVIDVEWFFRFFEDDYQPFLNKMSKYYYTTRFPLIANINALEIIKEHITRSKKDDLDIYHNVLFNDDDDKRQALEFF